MDYGGYTETRTLYVTHLAGWDMILGKLAFIALNGLIPAGPKPVTIQPEGMACFALKEWRKAGLGTSISKKSGLGQVYLEPITASCQTLVRDAILSQRWHPVTTGQTCCVPDFSISYNTPYISSGALNALSSTHRIQREMFTSYSRT